MPENLLTQVRSVLILDNDKSDAVQLREMLNTVPLWELDTTVHHSGEGIFPTTRRAFDLLLVTDDYGHSELGQIIEIAKYYQPHTHIVLLSTAQQGAHSPQEFIDAAHAGVSYCLVKENLSPDALLDMLQEVFHSRASTLGQTAAPPSGETEKDVHWILDLRKGTIEFDSAAQHALGFSPDTAPTTVQQWQATIHRDDLDPLMYGLNACIAGQADHAVRPYRVRHVSGQWLLAEAPSLLAERDEKGRTLRIVGRFRSPDAAGSGPPSEDGVAAASGEPPGAPLDSIVDEISLGVIKFAWIDEDFVYKSINRAAADSEQLNPHEVISQRLTTHTLGFENFSLGNALRQVHTDGARKTQRVMRLNDDATASWREIIVQRLPNGELLVEIRDISEHVEHDTKRRHDERIWWHIVNSLPDMCVLLDDNGNVMRVISGEWQQPNIDSAALAGKPIANILLADERDRCQESVQKAFNTGKTQTATYTIDSIENELRIQVKIALLRTEVNAPRQVIWMAREMTEPRIEVDTLINDQELFSEMLQRAPLLIAITDMEGRYERVNPYFAQLLQQPSDAIVGKTDAQLFNEKVALQLQNLDQKLLAEGIAQKCDIALTSDSGEQNFRVIKIPLHGMSMLTQNIFTLAIPLAGPAVAQNEQPKLEQRQSIDELVGDIARDFRDVLVNLTEHTQMALSESEGEPTSEIATYLRAVMNSSQRARDLVLQMLNYQDADSTETTSGATDLTLFTTGIVDLLRNTVGQHLQISSDLQPNLRVQELDSLRLQNALVQLFRAAQSSFDSSGHLSVCLRVLTQEDHTCAYCYAKISGQFVEISMHNSMQTNADAVHDVGADLPQDETLLSQIKRIHELLKPYSGHIMWRGEAGREESWCLFLAVDPDAERALKICPADEAEQEQRDDK